MTGEIVHEKDIISFLRYESWYGPQRVHEIARDLGVDPQRITDVTTGRTGLQKKIAKGLQYRKLPGKLYEPIP